MAIRDMLVTTTRPRSQTPSEQPPARPDPVAPSVIASSTHYESEYALASHLSHLLNAAVSCLNVYLSFEPLAGKAHAGNLQPRTGVIDLYRSGMYAQASILHDLTANINTVLRQLLHTSLYEKVESLGPYSCLVDAARAIPDAVADLLQQTLVEAGQALIPLSGLPSPGAVARMHTNTAKLVSLCHGDASQGIEGWKGCLKVVQEVSEQPQA